MTSDLTAENSRSDAAKTDEAERRLPAVETDSDYLSEAPDEHDEGSGGGDEPHDAEEHEEKMMTVIEHLEELRVRLIRSIVYVGAGMIVAFLGGKHILNILKAPAGNISFQALSLEEPVLVYLKVAFYSGLVLSSPLILYEICQFISPGLTRKERTVLIPVVVGSPVLFACGAAFAYFCVLPSMLNFFGTFGEGVIQVNQRLDFYVSLVSSFLLYMGLCFQLPLIIFALSFAGLVTSRQLISIWRYAFFAAGIVAAVVTPDPTAFSMLVTMAALVALYGLSIALLKFCGK